MSEDERLLAPLPNPPQVQHENEEEKAKPKVKSSYNARAALMKMLMDDPDLFSKMDRDVGSKITELSDDEVESCLEMAIMYTTSSAGDGISTALKSGVGVLLAAMFEDKQMREDIETDENLEKNIKVHVGYFFHGLPTIAKTICMLTSHIIKALSRRLSRKVVAFPSVSDADYREEQYREDNIVNKNDD